MEHLTKAQIVLLTLFVSFVASMATGIVVVTLMSQAPDPVNQTITNVIERTIEKITPTFVEKPGETVIVKDEDLVVAAIDRNIKSTVAFRVVGQDGELRLAGVGVIVSADGLIVTEKGNFGQGVLTTTIDGAQYALQVLSDEKNNSLGIGRLTPVSSTSTSSFVPVVMGSPDNLKLGQTALVIGGRDGKTISTGIITSLDMRTIVDKETKADLKVLDNIGISTRFSGSSNGAPIINLNGEVVGFLSINESAGSQYGIPANEAKGLIDTITKATSVKKI